MSEQLPSNPKLCPVCDWQLPPEYHSYSLRDHLATHNGLEVFLALRAEERTTDEPKADLELPEHLRDAVAVVARGKQILKEINPCRERLPSHPNYDCLHANGHEGQCDFKKRPTPGAENDPLVVWVLERLENCQEIAAKKTGDDRAGWIDDAEQFAAILRRLCSVSPPVVDWQPISSAPKDGRRILAVGMGPVFIASWGTGSEIWMDATGAYREPRLWMPLPDRPTVTKGAE